MNIDHKELASKRRIEQPEALRLADEAWNFDCSEYRGVRFANAAMMGKLQDCADMIRKLYTENETLRAAAQAVIDRWDTPLWKDVEPTAAVIGRLRAAVASEQTNAGGES